MPTISAVLLTTGKQLITQALVGRTPVTPTRFEVGDSYGYTPDPDLDTTIHGNLVHTGGEVDIRATVLTDNTARYELTINENYGIFEVGNLILYGMDEDDNEYPYVHLALPVPITKTQALNVLPLPSDYVNPGNRLVFNIQITHSDLATIASVTVVTPAYSSLAVFENSGAIPNAGVLTWEQVVSAFDTRTNTPVLVSRDSSNGLWAHPFFQHIGDPMLGSVNGGVDGFGYGPNPTDLLFGHFYTTPDAEYVDTYGGGTYTVDPVEIIGGASY